MDDGARECYEKHVDELLRFASGLVGPNGADDLVSSMFVRLFANDSWTTVTNLRAYLYTAVVNLARDQHRSTQRRLRREARQYERTETEHGGEVRPAVLAAMRHLTVRQRAVVFLTYWDDLDAVAIGERLGVSVQTVRRDLASARSSLQRRLS